MPNFNYSATDFPLGSPSSLIGSSSLSASWRDVIWAAISVGKSSLNDVLAHGSFSGHEARFRAHMVYANLMEKNGEFHHTSNFLDLDPTEKAAISYFFGMAFAKLVALKLFGAPWLIHLSALDPVTYSALPGRSRPDLIGWINKSEPLVIEAKGRSGGFSAPVLEKAKRQVQQIGTVGGAVPKYRVGCELYFGSGASMRLVDPEAEEGNEFGVDGSFRDLMEHYYGRYRGTDVEDWGRVQIRGATFDSMAVEDLDLSILIDSRLRVATPGQIEGVALDIRDSWNMEAVQGTELYPDGLVIRTGSRWNEEAMARQPDGR